MHFYFGDERCVPPDHSDSNFLSAQNTLFSQVPIPETNIFRMTAEDTDRNAAARAYEKILPERFDLLLLGIGEDGHTASLFPGQDSLREATRRVIPVRGSKPPPERLSITPPVITDARETLVLISGTGKCEIVKKIFATPYAPERYPVQLAQNGTWLFDADAAGLVQK